MKRRTFLASAGALPLAIALPAGAQRTFLPSSDRWRTFEVTTTVSIADARGATQAWIPLPSLTTDWQVSEPAQWSGNARAVSIDTDRVHGATMLHARFDDRERAPVLTATCRIRTRDRSIASTRAGAAAAAPAELALALRPTALMPLDGIVRTTARGVVGERRRDVDKVRALYDWVVMETHREPTVRGCGVGDIAAMLESGNLSGKCADINALFVGLCRAAGVPARDLYGIRVAKSAFGYRELGAGPDITKAQHCRAEVYLEGDGWVAMDPADVGKVMRQESAEWIRDARHPLVAPVYEGLFGRAEGNWIAYNTAHDVPLPGSTMAPLGFLMYPQAETGGERLDALDPDTFRYRIVAREIDA